MPDPEENVPTYQYACTACGHQLEAVQSFSDEPLTECPACEGRLRKVFNSVGIVFKGSGFYRTDSRSSGSDTASNGASKPAKSDSSSSGDSGSSNGSSTSASNGSSSSSGSSNGGSTSKAPAASTAASS
ncbi:FmdB family zinc ribbon protein [Micromonospora sp. LZ34]